MNFVLPFSFAMQEPADLLPDGFRFLGVRLNQSFGPLHEGQEFYGIEIINDQVSVFDANGDTLKTFSARVSLTIEAV